MKQNPTLSNEELSGFCWQLSLLLRAGIDTESGIELMLENAANAREKALLEGLCDSMHQGEPLTAALEKSGAFPVDFLRMLEIGQETGRSEEVLAQMTTYYRQEADTDRSLRRAVGYPAAMAILIAVLFLVLVVRVLPVFQQVFSGMGMTLSPAVQWLFAFGQAGRVVAVALAAVLIICAGALLYLLREGSDFGMRLLGKTEAGRSVDRSRFSSAMNMMLESGLTMDEAMGRACRLLEKSTLAPVLEECRKKTEEGMPFYQAAGNLFPPIQIGMLAAAFRVGMSGEAMKELAVRCGDEANERLSTLLNRFEYGLVIVLCGVVGLVLLTVMLPLLGALSAIGG